MKLVILQSPYRSLMEPLLDYIEQRRERAAGRLRHGDPAGVRAGEVVAAPAHNRRILRAWLSVLLT